MLRDPILIMACPRSGSSMTAGLFHLHGVWDKGIYMRQHVGDSLPDDARIVFYPGPRDPSTDMAPWAVEHWR